MSEENLEKLHRTCEQVLEEARRTMEEARRCIERTNHNAPHADRQQGRPSQSAPRSGEPSP